MPQNANRSLHTGTPLLAQFIEAISTTISLCEIAAVLIGRIVDLARPSVRLSVPERLNSLGEVKHSIII